MTASGGADHRLANARRHPASRMNVKQIRGARNMAARQKSVEI
jgi:hypothetical protein